MTYGTQNPKIGLLAHDSLEDMLQKMVQQMKGFPQVLSELEEAIENDLRRRHYRVDEDIVHSHPVYSAIEKMMS